MKPLSQGALPDVMKGSIASITLYLAYTAIPVLGMLPGFFIPFPALFYALKSGRWTGLTIVGLTSLILAPTLGINAMLLFLLQGGCLGLAMAEFLQSGKGIARSISYSVLINLALIALVAGAYALHHGTDPHAYIVKGIRGSIAETVSLYEKSGFKGDDLKSVQAAMTEAGILIGRIYPALAVLFVGLIGCLNAMLLKRVAVGKRYFGLGDDITFFRNPDQLVWVLIATGFAMLPDIAPLNHIALNILIVTLAMYFIQGIAVSLHFFTRYGMGRFFRTFFYVLLFIQPYLAVAVTAVGIFDLWGNFRTPKQQNL